MPKIQESWLQCQIRQSLKLPDHIVPVSNTRESIYMLRGDHPNRSSVEIEIHLQSYKSQHNNGYLQIGYFLYETTVLKLKIPTLAGELQSILGHSRTSGNFFWYEEPVKCLVSKTSRQLGYCSANNQWVLSTPGPDRGSFSICFRWQFDLDKLVVKCLEESHQIEVDYSQ